MMRSTALGASGISANVAAPYLVSVKVGCASSFPNLPKRIRYSASRLAEGSIGRLVSLHTIYNHFGEATSPELVEVLCRIARVDEFRFSEKGPRLNNLSVFSCP